MSVDPLTARDGGAVPTGVAVTSPDAGVNRIAGSLRSVSCPQCAGPLQSADGERVVRCRRCGTAFLTPTTGGYSRRFFPAHVDKLKAVGTATAWLREHPDAPDDIREAAFVEAHLLYAPIWEVRAHVVGWEFGKRLRAKAEAVRQGDQQTVQMILVEEGVEEGFFTERRMYQEAADLGALGMRRPHISGRETALPYLPGELESGASVLRVGGDLEGLWRQARPAFLTPPTGAVARSSRLFLLKERSALVYYPLWVLRYRYRGRLYEMTVDGRTGVVHAARAPADSRRRIRSFLVAAAALAAAVAVVLSLGSAADAGSEAWVVVVALVALLSGGIVWRFSLIREVEYHEPFSV